MIFPAELNQPAISRLLFPQSYSSNGFSEEAQQIETPNARYVARLFKAEKEESPAIILFPATNADLTGLQELADGLLQQHISLLAIACQPCSEEGQQPVCLQDYADEGAILFDKAAEILQKEGGAGALFVSGHGLGFLPAITAMIERAELVKGIFLEGAICNLQQFLERKESAEKITINNTAYFQEVEKAMQAITKPTMIFHGARDSISTTAQAEKLQSFSGARQKQFFVIPGAETPATAPLCHWAGALYFSTIRTFIDTVCGTNSWRQRRKKHKEQ